MAKQKFVLGKRPKAPAFKTIKVGDLTMRVRTPTKTEVVHNIEASTSALKRATKRLILPGVRLHERKGVPFYSADPERPGYYIRRLDGKTDRGVLEKGAFKTVG